MKLFGKKKEDLDKFPLDFYSVGHFILGHIGYIIIYLMGFYSTIPLIHNILMEYVLGITIFIGLFWELLENNICIKTRFKKQKDSLNNSLYFHCSPQGLKLNFIKQNPKVCATIIEDGGYVVNECGHNYKTVVFWGTLEIVSELDKKKYGMQILLNHLENDVNVIKEKIMKSDEYYSKMEVLKLDIIQIHGKAGR